MTPYRRQLTFGMIHTHYAKQDRGKNDRLSKSIGA
jgi:hypothetical protein